MQWLPYILGGVIVLFAALQLRVIFASWRARGRAAPDFQTRLSPEQQAFDRFLLYFYSPSCGPCRTMGPHIDALAERHANVVKFDISEDLDLARAFAVKATPTTVLVREGVIERMLVGPLSEKRLESLLG